MNYEDLKQIIESNIKDNDRGEITAEVMRDVLKNIVDVLDDGYIFGGVVTPADSPRYSDAKMFYIAREPGLYKNFGALEVSSLGIITLDEDWSWSWVSMFPKYASSVGDSEKTAISQKAFTEWIAKSVGDVSISDGRLIFFTVDTGERRILTGIDIRDIFNASEYYNKKESDARFVRVGEVDDPTKARDAANKQYVDEAVGDVLSIKLQDFLNNVSSSTLIPGKSYRIIDYVSTNNSNYEYDNGSSRFGDYYINTLRNPFDIVVKAISGNEISNEAFAMRNIKDYGYFANTDFSKWRLKVSIGNFQFSKGFVVYYMLDEFGNEAPYDFKNLVFRLNVDGNGEKYYYTFTKVNDDGTIVDASLGYLNGNELISDCCNNSIAPQIIDGRYYTNANVFIMDSLLTTCKENKIGSDCYMNVIYGGSSRNTIEDGCEKNVLQGLNADNVIGTKSKNNTLGQGCERNRFGQGCDSNTMMRNCTGNVFGNTCRENVLEDGATYNTFGNVNIQNYLKRGCSFNNFESFCFEIRMNVEGCTNNTFGNKCQNIQIGSECSSNTFENNCYNIEIYGVYSMNNSNIGEGCHDLKLNTGAPMIYYVIVPGTTGLVNGTLANSTIGFSVIVGKNDYGEIMYLNPIERGLKATIDDDEIYVRLRGHTWREIASYVQDVKESTTYQDEKTIMTYQGRLLLLDGEYVHANDIAKPASYTTKEHPLGTWIEATDGSLISSENWKTEGADKTAQSVVLITADHQFRIGLQNAYSSNCAWGGYGTDISGITNKTAWTSAVQDFNAKENTDAIIATLNPNWKGEALTDGKTSGHIDSSTVVYTGSSATTKGAPAAEACRLYSSGNIAAGKWDLPAFGHLYLMYLNKAAINACLTACGGAQLTADYNWSSTEYYSNPAWFLYFATGSQYTNYKYSSYYVRAVSAF